MGLLEYLLNNKEKGTNKTEDTLFEKECKVLGLDEYEIEECRKSKISPG